MQEGRKEGRRGENEIGKTNAGFMEDIWAREVGLRTRGHSIGNAGKIEPYTLFGSLLSFFKNVVSLPGV